jgi:hypothetical protein
LSRRALAMADCQLKSIRQDFIERLHGCFAAGNVHMTVAVYVKVVMTHQYAAFDIPFVIAVVYQNKVPVRHVQDMEVVLGIFYNRKRNPLSSRPTPFVLTSMWDTTLDGMT